MMTAILNTFPFINMLPLLPLLSLVVVTCLQIFVQKHSAARHDHPPLASLLSGRQRSKILEFQADCQRTHAKLKIKIMAKVERI
jgi:hypothetical protein